MEFPTGMACKAMAVVPQLGWVCYSNGSKVHVFHPATLKEVGVLDLEAAEGASPAIGFPGETTIEGLHFAGRWLFCAFSSRSLPTAELARSGLHPSAVPVGLVCAWDVSSGLPVRHYPLAPDQIVAHKFGPVAMDSFTSGEGAEPYLFTASLDSSIKMWQFNAATGVFACQAFDATNGHVRGVKSLVFASGRVFTGSVDRTVKVWNPATTPPTCTATIPPPDVGGAGAALGVGAGGLPQEVVAVDSFTLGDKPYVIVAYTDGAVRCFDVSAPDMPVLLDSPSTVVASGSGGADPNNAQVPVKLSAMCALRLHIDESGGYDDMLVITAYAVSVVWGGRQGRRNSHLSMAPCDTNTPCAPSPPLLRTGALWAAPLLLQALQRPYLPSPLRRGTLLACRARRPS